MATATSRLGELIDAMAATLEARSGLAGVNILTGPASDEELGIEYIALAIGEIQLPKRFAAAGNRLALETLTIPCELQARAEGAGNPARKVARDRALALYAEVEDAHRTAVAAPGGSVTFGVPEVAAVRLSSARMGQGYVDNERTVVIGFEFEADVYLVSA
jgi:hypothetical protein